MPFSCTWCATSPARWSQVGDGRRPENWIGECLQARDRERIGKTAPARGLYLVDVLYPGYDFPAGSPPPLLSGIESLERLQPPTANES